MLPISVLQTLSTRMVPGDSPITLRPLISSSGPNTWNSPEWLTPPQYAAENVHFDVAADGTWAQFSGSVSFLVPNAFAEATTSESLNWQENGGTTSSDGLVVFVNTTYTDAKIYSVVLETETSVGDLEAGFLTWEMNMTLSDPNTFRTDATGTWFMLPYNDFQPMTSGSGSDSTGVKMARGAKKKRLSFRCKSWGGLQPGDFRLELNKIARFVYGK